MMKWEELLCSDRPIKNEYESVGDLRSEFEKDYHRIIESSCFRRLQDKTQVFPLDKSDFIRTRLTHSLEVSSLGRSLGQNAAKIIMAENIDPDMNEDVASKICEVLQCAGLVHDIGNPPFGHFGEETIRDWFEKNLSSLNYNGRKVIEYLDEQETGDLLHFEGNAQGLRMLSKLHFLGSRSGMNLTFSLLSAIIKYPVSSVEADKGSGDIKNHKPGYFKAEEDFFSKVCDACGTGNFRNPMTFILEAADDIAYATADIEDAMKKGFLSYRTLFKELKKHNVSEDAVEKLRDRYEYMCMIDCDEPEESAVMEWLEIMRDELIVSATRGFADNYHAIMNGSFDREIICDGRGKGILDALKRIAFDFAFVSKEIFRTEIAANTILSYILDRMIPAVLQFDRDVPPGLMEEKYITLIPERYMKVYYSATEHLSDEEKVYFRILLATDFISSMTDSYARDLYEELNGYRLH
ncbi:MAG: deoxyguanosinetriphosphate triphosphohydrolase [Lachnospiraceae bacterium]|jgi:dGTPase